MLKGFCNLCDVTRGTDTSVRLKSAPLISCWPLRPDCVAAVAVITDVAPAPLADGVELRGRIVANAVWRVRDCKMAISTVVSENGARAEFEGGVKQKGGSCSRRATFTRLPISRTICINISGRASKMGAKTQRRGRLRNHKCCVVNRLVAS